MISSDLLSKLCAQQNHCIRILDSRLSVTELYKKYKILNIDNVIDLELCKLGFKLNNNILPVNLLTSLKGNARGKTLEKNTTITQETKKNSTCQ